VSDADDADDLARIIEFTDDELPPEEPLPSEDDHDIVVDHDSLLDRLRDTGVGTDDPNIVGDAGPVDVPPGADPPEG
jgi:hypothetical protein